MWLFRNKRGDGVHAHTATEMTASQALGDPEQPPSAHSAPHFEGVRINTDLQPSSSQQHSRAISAPELGKRTAQIDELTPHQKRTLAHLHALTTVMDNAVTIPIIRRKVGLDAMLGLIPYVGDIAGATVGSYIISQAMKYNLPKRLVLHMLVNQAIDSCVGVVPLLGDIFDIGFKANVRNIALLEEHLQHPKAAKRADTCFLCGLFFLVVIVPIIFVAGIIVAIVVGVLAATGNLH